MFSAAGKLVERLEAGLSAEQAAEAGGNVVAGAMQSAQKTLGIGDPAFTPADRALSSILVLLGTGNKPVSAPFLFFKRSFCQTGSGQTS